MSYRFFPIIFNYKRDHYDYCVIWIYIWSISSVECAYVGYTQLSLLILYRDEHLDVIVEATEIQGLEQR